MLSGTLPNYSSAYNRVWNSSTQQYEYASVNVMQNQASLSLTQNIGPTGGTISLNSDITHEIDLENDNTKYITSPLNIMLTQPIFRYNELRWQKKIEPMKYEEARKTYLRDVENVRMQAVQNFFGLALAQINREIARPTCRMLILFTRSPKDVITWAQLLRMSFFRWSFHT